MATVENGWGIEGDVAVIDDFVISGNVDALEVSLCDRVMTLLPALSGSSLLSMLVRFVFMLLSFL